MTDPVLMRAQGKLVVFLASLLHGAGVQPLNEFAETLALFATVVAEDAPAEGDVLAYWAASVRDLAREGAPEDWRRPAT